MWVDGFIAVVAPVWMLLVLESTCNGMTCGTVTNLPLSKTRPTFHCTPEDLKGPLPRFCPSELGREQGPQTPHLLRLLIGVRTGREDGISWNPTNRTRWVTMNGKTKGLSLFGLPLSFVTTLQSAFLRFGQLGHPFDAN